MKYISKIAVAIIISLTFFACNDETENKGINLVDNSENISKLINSIDFVFKKHIENRNLSEENLGKLFIQKAKRNGLRIIEINNDEPLVRSSSEEATFSSEYWAFSDEIKDAKNFLSEEEYKNNLLNLKKNIINSDISQEEKQLLVDNIGFMVAFVDWMGTLESQYTNKLLSVKTRGLQPDDQKSGDQQKCDGWWSCWGKCVAGTLGGAITGGATLGVAGAAIGTVTVPVIGTISAGAVGAVAGAIGGGLTGAAASC